MGKQMNAVETMTGSECEDEDKSDKEEVERKRAHENK